MKDVKQFLFIITLFLATVCKEEGPSPSTTHTSDPENTAKNDPDTINDETAMALNYLALGDSYTIGESVESSERFPVILARELREEGLEIEEPEIIATTGWTTADLKNGVFSAGIVKQEYDMISLLIGVNNQYQGRSLEEYKKEFRELLLLSLDLANGNKGHVFVVSIPDYGYTPFGASGQEEISAEIEEFNKVNKEITASFGVRYFNITPLSRNGLSDPSLVAGDGLHPSGKMYQQWVDLMLEEVIEIAKAP